MSIISYNRKEGKSIRKNVIVHESARIYGRSEIGENSIILEHVILGYPQADILRSIVKNETGINDSPGVKIGRDSIVRSNTIIYSNTNIGDNLRGGHNVLVREKTSIGNNVLLGTNVVIDGMSTIGNNVSIQTNAYIPINTIIEDYVFLGPCAVLTNDKYPIRKESELKGPEICRGASIGANATILPGIRIGEGAMVAVGSVVTKDVPDWHLAKGIPAKIAKLPEELKTLNRIG